MTSISIKIPKRFEVILICIIILFGLLLRLGPIAFKDFLEDELFSIAFATETKSIVSQLLNPVDDRPPLFYLFVKVLLYFSRDMVILRMPFVILSLSCVPLGYILVRKWSQIFGLFLATVFAISPFFIEYGIQVRDYALLLPITVLNVLVISQIIEEVISGKKVKFLLFFTFVFLNTLGLFINYIYLFFLFSQLATTTLFVTIVKRRILIKELLTLWITHVPSLLLILLYLVRQSPVIIRTTEWIPFLNTTAIEQLIISSLGAGFSLDEVFVVSPVWDNAVAYCLVGFFILCIILLFEHFKKLPLKISFLALLGPLTFLFSIILVITTSNIIGRSLFLPRTFLPAVVLFTISESILLFLVLRFILRKSLSLLPLFIVFVAFLGFCYWDGYLDRYPFFLFDQRKENFQSFSQAMSFIKARTDRQTQLVFFPLHYQSLFTIGYFYSDYERLSQIAVEARAESIDLKKVPSQGSMIYVVTDAMLPERRDRYYSQEYIEENLWVEKNAEKLCITPRIEIFSNNSSQIFECKISSHNKMSE